MLSRQQQDPEPCSCLWGYYCGRVDHGYVLPLFAGSKISYLLPFWRLRRPGLPVRPQLRGLPSPMSKDHQPVGLANMKRSPGASGEIMGRVGREGDLLKEGYVKLHTARGLKVSRPRPLVGSPCDSPSSVPCCESEQPRGDPQRDPLLAAAAQLQPADSTRQCRHHVCSNEDEKVERIMPTRRFSGANNAKLGPWWPHRLRGLGGSAAERPKWRALVGDLVWGSEEDHSRRIVAANGCFYCW